MHSQYCRFCGTAYSGRICPGCGSVGAETEPTGAGAPMSRPGRGLRTEGKEALRKGRRVVWGLIGVVFLISGLYVRRLPGWQEQFLQNMEHFSRQRAQIVYVWERPEGVGTEESRVFPENVSRFLALGEEHFFHALEEVGQIWSTP